MRPAGRTNKKTPELGSGVIPHPHGLFVCPVALLVFLSAAAWTGIVAPNLFSANHLLHRFRLSRTGPACLLQFARLAPLELLLHIVQRGLYLPRRMVASADCRRLQRRLRLRRAWARWPRFRPARVANFVAVFVHHPHQVQYAYRLFFEVLHHLLEESE